MKKLLLSLLLAGIAVLTVPAPAKAIELRDLGLPPVSCSLGTCPSDLIPLYESRGETCVASFEEFTLNPMATHFWAEDPDVTAQGQADERARQFIYWVLNRSSIDDHIALKNVWNSARNVAYFFTIFLAAVLGLGMVIGRKTNFNLRIGVWPAIWKIAAALLYISFSAAIVLTLIQVGEVIMKFFSENLGGRDLFNIYFAGSSSSESNYTQFIGCRDLNYNVQEAISTELFMLKLTNITYYVMGTMLLLRKILLWFLLFVSPFLAILFPFVFIRNIGWIWIGVFFQWLFYGPLFALFLGGLSQVWRAGIPFVFDFSRVGKPVGYVYPTGINILYGGPAQTLGATSNANYIDPFVEYIITLIMLWAVTFFPWWLLRIFRDYCCDGIYATKNILMSLYDNLRNGPPPVGPTPISPTPAGATIGTALKMPQKIEQEVKIKMETIEEIRKVNTEDISKSLNLSATKLTDIARFETNKQTNESMRKNIDMLKNPIQAETPVDRQKFMNLRTELFSRAVKQDRIAQSIISATSTSRVEQIKSREEFLKEAPKMQPVSLAVSIKVEMPEQKVASVSNSYVSSVANNSNVVNNVSQVTNAPVSQIQSVLSSYSQHINEAPTQVAASIAKDTNVPKEKVVNILQNTFAASTAPADTTRMVNEVARTSQLEAGVVHTVVTAYRRHLSVPASVAVQKIAEETKMAPEQVNKVLANISDRDRRNLEVQQVVEEVAARENVDAEKVKKVIASQAPLVTEPEKNLEEAIAVPAATSIEEYEEVKKMWQQQYEKGEVPVTENIASRQQWVDQDTIFITNTLNKLLSQDETMRAQGLEDVSYILPIFLINSLKAQDLTVYLKAKLEAAKSVSQMLEKEKEITEKLKAKSESEEELVEAAKPKAAEQEKTMDMQQELEEPPEKEMPKELPEEKEPPKEPPKEDAA